MHRSMNKMEMDGAPIEHSDDPEYKSDGVVVEMYATITTQ
jgi:hypothetical protein